MTRISGDEAVAIIETARILFPPYAKQFAPSTRGVYVGVFRKEALIYMGEIGALGTGREYQRNAVRCNAHKLHAANSISSFMPEDPEKDRWQGAIRLDDGSTLSVVGFEHGFDNETFAVLVGSRHRRITYEAAALVGFRSLNGRATLALNYFE